MDETEQTNLIPFGLFLLVLFLFSKQYLKGGLIDCNPERMAVYVKPKKPYLKGGNM